MNIPGRRFAQILSIAFLVVVAIIAIFVYGITVGKFKLPPYSLYEKAFQQYESARNQLADIAVRMNVETETLPLYYKKVDPDSSRPIFQEREAYPGVNLVTRVAEGTELAVDLLDMKGEIIHSWNVDWFRVWPDAGHVPDFLKPKSKPGTHIHGAVVFENGDLVFNYEHLGLVKLSKASEVLWRLPYRTHHSVHMHSDGMLWVCGQKGMMTSDPRYPHRKPPFDKYTILEVDPDNGSILNEWFVADILQDNGFGGLLDLVPSQPNVQIGDDRLHLNDAEPFPADMAEGFFRHGDVIVSLRNVSTVFVFNKDSGKIRYISTGMFVKQHDPDFVDGNRFSVFDNNWIKTIPGVPIQSRIVMVTAPNSEIEVVYPDSPDARFYTPYMGKHQWLPNGNLLITESIYGRAFEVSPAGEIVWQYVNKVSENHVALVEEVTRLPVAYAGFIGEHDAD